MAETIKTPVGDAPVIPLVLLMAGLYLAWFGVHYWRSDIKYPTTPVQHLLQGKGAPPAVHPQSHHDELLADVKSASANDSGQQNQQQQQSQPSNQHDIGTSVAGYSDAKAALQATAKEFGWDKGAQWAALDWIEMAEAGYNPQAKNASSGAYGMAQSLGHPFKGGPAPNGVNEYGGFGLSATQSRAASMGDPAAQSLWMCNYIRDKYGNPVLAKGFHQANGWY